MTETIPVSLSRRNHVTKENRMHVRRTIIAKAQANPSWTHKQMVTWISEEFRIKVTTGYQCTAVKVKQLPNSLQFLELASS
jgi:hypothetical protein